MSHTLHRYGPDKASLEKDYVVFAIAAQTVNAKGINPEFKVFEEIVRKYNPVNFGDMKTGNEFVLPKEVITASYADNTIVHAVFTDKETVAAVLKDLAGANLSVSIVVSGLLEETAECCHKAGIEPHTVEYSLGIMGKTELIPDPNVVQISTMCGHGMVPFNLIKDLSAKVTKGTMTARKAAEKLAGLCHCGVFNPDRAEEILKLMAQS